ncbi:hypothetical protein BaRGS_00033386, partial [Batillaria attramentaria]
CDAYGQLTETSLKLHVAERLLSDDINSPSTEWLRDPLCSLSHILSMRGMLPDSCECQRDVTVRHIRGRTHGLVHALRE